MNQKIQTRFRSFSGGLASRTLFSADALGVQVAVVTLLLQLISFATTWQGAAVYFGGVFPLAPLLFAAAVQSTVWFFSNALRRPATGPRLAALGVAVGCSTLFSFIGVYNYVAPPQLALQSSYAEAAAALTAQYDAQAARAADDFSDTVNRLCTALQAKAAELTAAAADLAACRAAYDATAADTGLASAVSAPTRWQYRDYAEYLAAYNAYLASVTQNAGTEDTAARTAVLQRYGFADIAALTAAEAQNAAARQGIAAALGGQPEDTAAQIETLRAALQQRAAAGQPDRAATARLLAACTAAGVENAPTTDALLAPLDAWQATTDRAMLPAAETLAATLDGGQATRGNAAALRTLLQAELQNAALALARMDADAAPPPTLPQIYLLPFLALFSAGEWGTAWFCFGMAALVDGLTLLFAFSGREGQSLLNARRINSLFAGGGRQFTRQATACLPGDEPVTTQIAAFLAFFTTDESAMASGHSLAAPLNALRGWDRLIAFLCQTNLARILPAAPDSPARLLLKTRFLLWANEQTDAKNVAEIAAQ